MNGPAPSRRRIREIGDLLARAFCDDPFYAHIVPDPRARPASLAWFFRTATRYGATYGRVDATPGELAGVAIWLDGRPTTLRMLRAGMAVAPFVLGFRGFSRLLRCMSLAEALHRRAAPGPHLYLLELAVDPARQGRGIGRSLLEPALARADARGLPCYLETTRASNVPIYERFGFRVVVEGQFPDGGPRYWTMSRPPRSQ